MILITGWTGNTGSLVVERIKRIMPDRVIVGVAKSIPTTANNLHSVVVEAIDLNHEDSVRELFLKYQFNVIIHIANIRYSPILLKLANHHKIPHVILIHTTGIYSQYRKYSSLYNDIEKEIFSSTFPFTNYTILRPTMIYGNSKDHNIHKLIKFLNKHRIFPVFGDGNVKMQPVHVEDLADAIVDCMKYCSSNNSDYDLSGGSVITYNEMLYLITKHLNKKVIFIHIPITFAKFLVKVYNLLSKNAAITVEQVERLQEDKAYIHEKAAKDFGYEPRAFEIGIEQEILNMKSEGILS